MKLQLEFIQNETLSLKWNVKKAPFNPFLKRRVSKQIMALKSKRIVLLSKCQNKIFDF